VVGIVSPPQNHLASLRLCALSCGMATLRDRASDSAAENIEFIPAASATVADFVSDAWPRKGFTGHVVQGIGTGTAKVYGTVLPPSKITVPFVLGEWAELGTVTGGVVLKLPESYSAIRIIRTVGADAFAVQMLSYHPPYAG